MPRSFWERRAEQQAAARMRRQRAIQGDAARTQMEIDRRMRELESATTQPRMRPRTRTVTEIVQETSAGLNRISMERLREFYQIEYTPGAVWNTSDWSSEQTVTIPFENAPNTKTIRELKKTRLRRFKDYKPSGFQYHINLDKWQDENYKWTPIKDMTTNKLETYIDRIEKGWECAGQRHKLVSLKRELEARDAASKK